MVAFRRKALALVVGLAAMAPAPAACLAPEDVLLVGDSVTAGVWFLSLSQESAAQGWAGQLAQRLGLAVDDLRLDGVFPLDHQSLAEDGLGFLALRYPWQALPILFSQHSRFAASDERVIFAVPGQLASELLAQDSDHQGKGSAGWTFANLFLPEHLSVIETIEQWRKRPRWIVLFIGANDALASLGIVGRAASPSPEQFEAAYDELAKRLRARLSGEVTPDHLLLLTLPDVTRLPLLQPDPDARDEHGALLPAGSKVSAFLAPYRDRYHPEEVWTPDELAQLQQRVRDYNAAIEQIAARHEATIVDMRELFDELLQDERFGAMQSPYFSPDLHHPSHLTQGFIAERVWTTMDRLEAGPLPDHPVRLHPLPTNADYGPDEMRRVVALNRLALLGLSDGPLPPDPTFYVGVDLGGHSGRERLGQAAMGLLVGVESTPSPTTTRWLSRGTLQGRMALAALDGNDLAFAPEAGLALRAGVAFEQIGAYSWARVGLGGQVSGRGGAGWYLRAEWRALFADVSSRDGAPDRFEAGLRLGWLFGRVGRIGN